MKLLLSFVAAFDLVLLGAGVAASPRIITAKDVDDPINLHMGQELVLNLESNPTTGYRWFLQDVRNSGLTTLGEPVYQRGGSLPGAGGVESWIFRASKAGDRTLRLEYRHPWEKETPPARSVVFQLRVR
jgi:inhibitor of cysteine peptidase